MSHESEAKSDEAIADVGAPRLAELEAELSNIGLTDRLAALVMKEKTLAVMGVGAAILIMPIEVMLRTMGEGTLSYEAIALGLRQSVETLRSHGATALLGETLLSLARATQSFDSLENRFALVLEGIATLRAVGARHRLGRAYVDLGENLKDGGFLYDALQAFEMATEIARECGDRGALAASLYNRGVICRRLSLEVEALELLDAAEDALPKVRAAQIWVQKLASERALNRMSLGRDEEALECIESWLSVSTIHYGPYLYRADILTSAKGLSAGLTDYCTAAIRATEEIQSNASGRFRRLERQRLNHVFERAVEVALMSHRPELAFGLLELSRFGSAVIGRREENISKTELDVDIREAFQTEKASVVDECCEAVASGDKERLLRGQEAADWLVARAEIMRYSAKHSSLSRKRVESWATRVQKALPNNEILLEFAAIAGRIHVFALTRDVVVARPTDLELGEALLLGQGFARECQGLFPIDALDVLASRLLGPVREILNTVRSVVVVPSLGLYGMPFHAMRLYEEPLVKTHRVTYAARAQDLVESTKRPMSFLSNESTWRGLGVPSVDYTDLPEISGVIKELEQVATKFVEPTCILDPPASSMDLLESDQCTNILHVACHGDFDPVAPLLSRLMMADRPVFAFEIMLTELDADVVVLSACETAEVHAGLGGHVQSLASAFVRAGALNVVAALWPVDDEAGAVCIERLYENLLAKDTISLAGSLQDAQMSLRREWKHLYFWAPFAAFGTE